MIGNSNVPLILVGNKNDLKNDRRVTQVTLIHKIRMTGSIDYSILEQGEEGGWRHECSAPGDIIRLFYFRTRGGRWLET